MFRESIGIFKNYQMGIEISRTNRDLNFQELWKKIGIYGQRAEKDVFNDFRQAQPLSKVQ